MHATDYLQRYFGYTTFRKGQADLIDAILSRQDVLGIMPTGAGKSICYQIPALMLEGISIVVSPLISLMQDQVVTLRQLGISSAYLNSSLSPAEQYETLRAAAAGQYKLLYVAPERLLTPAFLEFAQHADLAMLTVDEAHCVSQWGQNFRPNYLDIATFLETLSRRPIVAAFTATATGRVKEDITALLCLQNPATFVTGFDRENLYFSVETPKHKSGALLRLLSKRTDQSGIVYCSTRKAVEKVCDELQDAGFSAARYHAGLPAAERSHAQTEFLFDRTKIMVATNAFGMGIDKSNISFVVHYNMPKDVESYYQEAGRAGRDGSPADCVLFYSGQDVMTNQRLIRFSEGASEEQIERELARLSLMTFYCTTTDCLRGYILKYFGETPPLSCGHCGNCDTNFEEIDITIDAQKIISCVARAGERFGAGMIVDILRGTSNDRIQRFALDQLSTYGICDKPAYMLRQIIDHLLYLGYLKQSEGEYPLLQRTAKANALLRGQETLAMRIRKEERTTRAKNSKEAQLSEVLLPLYDALREVRADLARAQDVPAFVIFSDKILRDLCEYRPQNAAELLQVSGIGEAKRARYGAAVLTVITDYCAAHELPPSTLEAIASIGKPTAKRGKTPVLPSAAVLARITPAEKPIPISDLTKLINEVLTTVACSTVSAVKVGNWLVSEGFLEVVPHGEGTTKQPTAQGTALGITQKTRKYKNADQAYQVNFYAPTLQGYIIEHIPTILQWEKPKGE
ncbi:MAG: DNA helicase RecQ [Faecalibacterium sp.]